MGKNNKLYLLTPKGRNFSTKLSSTKFAFDPQERTDTTTTYIPPDHVPLPSISEENQVLYEMQTTVIFVISMCTQYLNLFRTYWWISDTYRRYAMNFHLINQNVVLFCSITIVKSFVIHLVYKVHRYLPLSWQLAYIYLGTGIVTTAVLYLQTHLLLVLFASYSFWGLLTFLYPVLIYSAFYYPNLIRTYHWMRDHNTTPVEIGLHLVHFVLQPSCTAPCFPVSHICTNISPFFVRDEVDKLKTVFNDRLKFILTRSIIVAYYAAFVPIALVPPDHEYDTWWTVQHITCTFICTFFMLTSHLYSPQFYDVLHQSSLHLGKWQKLEARNTLVPCFQWADATIYGPGIVVRHLREYYKSEANMTCAEPGNQAHFRFYIVFSDPSCGFISLLFAAFSFIFFQFAVLCHNHEWYKLIAMSLMMLTNSLAVFRLVRSYWILKEVYKEEKLFTDPKSE